MSNLEEFDSKIAEIEKSLHQLQVTMSPLDNSLQEINKTAISLDSKFSEMEEALLEEFKVKTRELREKKEAETQALREQRSEVNKQRALIAEQLREANRLLEAAKRDKLTALELQAAQEKMRHAEKQFRKMIENAPFKDDILDFQFQDLVFMWDAWINQANGILNANDMGLGKTFETISFIHAFQQDFFNKEGRLPRILWLTKKSLIKGTHREFRLWAPDHKAIAFINKGDPQVREMMLEMATEMNATIITNYEALNSNPLLKDSHWDLLVCDEVHKLRGGANQSGPTAIWKNVKALSKNARFLNFLTGSPINNHPREMWAYLNIFNEEKFPKLSMFESQYCYGYGQGVKVDFERLIKIMRGQVIRRRKDEVKIQLPEKTREFRFVELTDKQRDIYDKLKNEFFLWLDDQKTEALSITAVIAQLTYLRQVALYPGAVRVKKMDGTYMNLDCDESGKLDEALDIIEELHNEEEQVVVFSSQFNGPLEKLTMLLSERKISSAMIKGDTPTVDDVVKKFQDKEIDVLLINAKTGGEGLNLQKNPSQWKGGASHAIFLDLWYNPMFNVQAEDRIHRKGQVDPVTIHIIQAEDSVDQFIADILDNKQDMIDGIMENTALRPTEWREKLEKLL